MLEILEDKNQHFRFALKTEEGNILLESIDFNTKEEIVELVRTFPAEMDQHLRFERKTDHEGLFLFNLKDRKGRVIGKSQLYSSEAGMENGIKNLRNNLKHLELPL